MHGEMTRSSISVNRFDLRFKYEMNKSFFCLTMIPVPFTNFSVVLFIDDFDPVA